MDTSDTYIKMCLAAEAIQGFWQPSVGDWFMCYDDPAPPDDIAHGYYGDWRLEIIGKDDDQNLHHFKVGKEVWLPRQDQLQEMVRGNYDPFCGAMLTRFMDWYNATMQFLPSLEQLWLAFVMKEKYNKVWDGKVWT